jgi:hypothetical protein
MARIDRRQRLSLDESYRYYRKLSAGVAPDLFPLSRALNNVSAGLQASESNQFKLTRQLWRRLHEALFEAYIVNFPGSFYLKDASDSRLEFGQSWPEQGWVSFKPDGCRRVEDVAEMEIKRLYPRTEEALLRLWKSRVLHCNPSDFAAVSACEDGVCPVAPVVVGHEAFDKESSAGKQVAYQRWWELYWQAYCSVRRPDRAVIYRSMMALEAVFGDLYY